MNAPCFSLARAASHALHRSAQTIFLPSIDRFARARAHPPHTPPGRALERRPWFGRARKSARASAKAANAWFRPSRNPSQAQVGSAANQGKGHCDPGRLHNGHGTRPRWAVGPRTPPGRTGLRLRRPVGPGRRFCAFGAKGDGVGVGEATESANGGDMPTAKGKRHGQFQASRTKKGGDSLANWQQPNDGGD